MQAFKLRAATIESVFGSEASDSLLFAQTYIDAADSKTKIEQAKLFSELRWLPTRVEYEDIISYWTQSVLTREIIEQGIANGPH